MCQFSCVWWNFFFHLISFSKKNFCKRCRFIVYLDLYFHTIMWISHTFAQIYSKRLLNLSLLFFNDNIIALRGKFDFTSLITNLYFVLEQCWMNSQILWTINESFILLSSWKSNICHYWHWVNQTICNNDFVSISNNDFDLFKFNSTEIIYCRFFLKLLKCKPIYNGTNLLL